MSYIPIKNSKFFILNTAIIQSQTSSKNSFIIMLIYNTIFSHNWR